MKLCEIWDKIIKYNIALEQELQLITNIYGYCEEVLNNVIFERTGYRNMEQYEESEVL